METTNKFLTVLDLARCKELIASTPSDEIAILCPNYSINIQSLYDDCEEPEQMDWDFEEFEELVGATLFVNDYNDLCADPHGVMNDESSEDELTAY